MRKLFSLTFVLGLSLGLIGCRTVWDPTFMPAGYTYHRDVYKAPIGPESENLGYEYSVVKNAKILQAWRIAVANLADQLEEQIGNAPQAVYIPQTEMRNAFNATFDHVLREDLHGRGYTLVSGPEAAPLSIVYEAHIPIDVYEGNASMPEKIRNKEVEEFVLILNAWSEGELSGKAAGVYKLPVYGYEDEEILERGLTKQAGSGFSR